MEALPKYAEDLTKGTTYKEDGYYFATCLSIPKQIYNDGFNNYFRWGLFRITTKTGRFVENTTKKFLIKNQ